MSRLERCRAWWNDWDAGPLIRLALWCAVAAGWSWHHWQLTPADILSAGLGFYFKALLVSGVLFNLFALAGGIAIRGYFFVDDVLYDAGERLVLALWSSAPRLVRLSAAIALEFALAAGIFVVLIAWAGRAP